MDENALAALAADGDLAAFATLVRRTQGRLRAFLLRLTGGDHALADDLAQETLIEAHRKLAQFRGDGAFPGWLLAIAWNRFLAQRRSRRPEAKPLDDDAPAQMSDPGLRLDLERALYRVSANERAALTLCYALGFSHSEAAGMMAIPLGTLKAHVQRGRERLKTLLGE